MIHVFITNKQTLKLHLEYLFAGVGMKQELSPFLYQPNINFNWVKEKTLVSMLADISRVREGDKIAFYLQGSANQKGKLFGIFEAKSRVFFDENDDKNFLNNELGKGLSYRVLIKGLKVFSKGVEERDYLDDISDKECPWQLCWSLIYRKLKGNRGCTMLTEYEEKELIRKLKQINNYQCLKGENFSFDSEKEEIVISPHKRSYAGRKNNCDIKQRLLYKLQQRLAFETHLQTYILQNFDNLELKKIICPLPFHSLWIGNEMACGTGMQKIDLLIKQEDENSIFIKIIELKDEKIKFDLIRQQLSWYVKWVSWYIVPNYLSEVKKKIVIVPCIIAPSDNLINYQDLLQEKVIPPYQEIEAFKLEIILFHASNNLLNFRKVIFN